MDRETIKVPIFLTIISMHHDSIIHLPAEEGGTINRKQVGFPGTSLLHSYFEVRPAFSSPQILRTCPLVPYRTLREKPQASQVSTR